MDNSVAIVGGSNSSLTYTGSSVLGNGFTRMSLPMVGTGSTLYIDNFFGLADYSETGEHTFY